MSWLMEYCRNRREIGPTPCYFPDCHCLSAGSAEYDPSKDRKDWKPSKQCTDWWSKKVKTEDLIAWDGPNKPYITSNLNTPVYEWCWSFDGGQTTWQVQKGKEPNRFYRWIQGVIMGIHWRKIS